MSGPAAGGLMLPTTHRQNDCLTVTVVPRLTPLFYDSSFLPWPLHSHGPQHTLPLTLFNSHYPSLQSTVKKDIPSPIYLQPLIVSFHQPSTGRLAKQHQIKPTVLTQAFTFYLPLHWFIPCNNILLVHSEGSFLTHFVTPAIQYSIYICKWLCLPLH